MDEKSSVPTVTKGIPEDGDVEGSEEIYAAADVGEHRPGYTKKDQKDMYHMGKRQELMVGFIGDRASPHSSQCLAKFLPDLRRELHRSLAGNLGIRSDVSLVVAYLMTENDTNFKRQHARSC